MLPRGNPYILHDLARVFWVELFAMQILHGIPCSGRLRSTVDDISADDPSVDDLSDLSDLCDVYTLLRYSPLSVPAQTKKRRAFFRSFIFFFVPL